MTKFDILTIIGLALYAAAVLSVIVYWITMVYKIIRNNPNSRK